MKKHLMMAMGMATMAQGMFPSKNTYTYEREGKKIGRNETCPCGSGKKHKKCCAFVFAGGQ